MAGRGNPQPRYTLYVRLRDGIMRLMHLGKHVPVAHWHMVNYAALGCGVCVTPVGAKGVTIFEDEFEMVETFPRVEAVGGSGKTTAKLVAIEKEEVLVA